MLSQHVQLQILKVLITHMQRPFRSPLPSGYSIPKLYFREHLPAIPASAFRLSFLTLSH